MASTPVWQPAESFRNDSKLARYMRWLARTRGLAFADYDALWRWSVDDLEGFWDSIVGHYDIRFHTPPARVLGARTMPGAAWFPGATLNYVEQGLRHRSATRPAIIACNEAGERVDVGWDEFERKVANLAHALRALGVARGDRVVAFLPNIPETIIAFYAAASIGATWSLCSPDMGPVSVLDRFAQITPKVLIAVDGYRYGGKAFDRRQVVGELQRGLPTLEKVIVVPNLDRGAGLAGLAGALAWDDVTAGAAPLAVEPVPFDHPLWVVYSSGTTGMPKPMVHGHGGIVVEHVKVMGIGNDLGPDDVYHWFSSTSWFMWNLHISGLLVGATVAIYDGNPGWPDWGALWRFADRVKATFFGAGAAFFLSCMKAGVSPRQFADVSRLRGIGSTGSPLPPEGYRWVYDNVRSDVWLAPMSGGTDPATAFVGGNPLLPVHLGEMQCKCLGCKVEAFDDDGRPLVDAVGELVCTAPMPSMPLYFWNDAGGKRYHDSYFDVYPGVWRHGDWIRFTPGGGSVIYGRSDATIKRHGIRMGTAEIYSVVEALPEILDSVVVDLEYLGRESYMPLFVVLRPGVAFDDALQAKIREHIRTGLSARHVPNDIFEIAEVPRTLSGKKMELPIKKLLLGHSVTRSANPDSMANPGSLAYFVEFAARRNAGPGA
ncbi:MAG: acetoacetate--CoA ligase [Burkholderiales bacterium]|nr:acetoacetate--CoA ligase [Burkholderiales bacterium]